MDPEENFRQPKSWAELQVGQRVLVSGKLQDYYEEGLWVVGRLVTLEAGDSEGAWAGVIISERGMLQAVTKLAHLRVE